MLGWVLRVLLILFIARAVWRFLYGVFQGMEPRRQGTTGRASASVALVRDPVCGTYVVPGRALTLGSGASLKYFCSERCRDEYRAGARLAR